METRMVWNPQTSLFAILTGALITMTHTTAAVPDASTDPRINPKIRTFLAELNKNSSPYWEMPGPEVRAVLTGLQAKTPVDLSGVTITERTISEAGRNVKLYVIRPEKLRDR